MKILFLKQMSLKPIKVYDKMNRQIDVDAVRHVYTFNLLNKYKSPKKLCVIGDGKANFTLGSINFGLVVKFFQLTWLRHLLMTI